MPAKKSVKLPIAAGRCSVQSAAWCRMRPACGLALSAGAPVSASNANTCLRKARRAAGPRASSGLSVVAGGGFRGIARLAGKQPGFERGGDVEDVVADRDAAARCARRAG